MISRTATPEFRDGKLFLRGALYMADTPNANGISYPKEVLESFVQSFNNEPKKLFGTVFLDEKDENFTSQFRALPLKEAAAQIVTISMKPTHVEAVVEVLNNTPRGRFFKNLVTFTPNMKFGFSAVTMAETLDNVVKPDMVLTGFSIVPANALE